VVALARVVAPVVAMISGQIGAPWWYLDALTVIADAELRRRKRKRRKKDIWFLLGPR
jgi:hypothetical protein